ncbi:arginine N-succinyltransferase [Marinobacteraceae bacterium S3BR75-40.1]
MLIRPIAHKDLDALQQIAVESGPGFTSLVNDRDFLQRKIQRSLDSFARDVSTPGAENYLFVLEDRDTGEVMGTTGIEASAGLHAPLYHYHNSQVVHHSPDLGVFRRSEVLNLSNHYTGCTEVCTLFLRPQHRRAHAGKLLSKVRFLFMAQHPERFADTVIAEMRGVSSDDGRSPFWDWFRTHFVDLDFPTVTAMVGAGDNRFIAELMPKHPLYTQLLSPEARAVIGRVHEQTRPALRLLEAEGFRHKGYIDPFDGGPTVEAERDRIHSVASSRLCPVEAMHADTPWFNREQLEARGNVYLIANTGTADFRATVTDQALYLPQHDCLQVPASVLSTVGVGEGGVVRCVQIGNAQRQVASEPLAVAHPTHSESLYAR